MREDFDPEILELLILHSSVTNHFKAKVLEHFLVKKVPNATLDKFLKLILFDNSFRPQLSLEASKNAYQYAVSANHLELQVMVLLHASDDFAPRMLLSREVFFTCLRNGALNAAIKMAVIEYPRMISAKDLNDASTFSQGQLSFSRVESSSFQYNLRAPVQNNNSFLPMYSQQRAPAVEPQAAPISEATPSRFLNRPV